MRAEKPIKEESGSKEQLKLKLENDQKNQVILCDAHKSGLNHCFNIIPFHYSVSCHSEIN